jgi:signal transduction histidine kinase
MKKVAVIDDQDYILESTQLLLEFEGYTVRTASNGKKGIELIEDFLPDLILCDISMPEMDGYGVLTYIRSHSTLSSTPFVFLTARAERSDMRAGMGKGADDYLIKPYTRDELIAVVAIQFEKRERIEQKMTERAGEVARNVTYALPHEFRIVLNQVMGSAKYLKSIAAVATEPQIIEMTDDILSSSQRLFRITENFLTYVQIESFKADPEMHKRMRAFRTVEPGATMYDLVMAKAMKFARAEDLSIKGEVEGIAIEISTENFNKVLEELMDNALRFSENGTPIVVSMSANAKFFTVEIKDYGRGMSADQIANIGAYTQFNRMIHEQQGVGLGLIISKRIVELHDGDFSIESHEGKGTTVTFSLPIASDYY